MIYKLYQSLKLHIPNGLVAGTVVIALLFFVPIAVILKALFSGQWVIWQHLADTVLWAYIGNSFWLVLGVSLGVLLLGVPTAWLVSFYDFPAKHFFSWALLLPFAFPAYIIAYTYTGMLDAGGSVQTWIRSVTGLEYGEYWFFQVRSLGGAVVMLSLVLYPYVYLLARSAFLEQSRHLMDASRLAGFSHWQCAWRIALPMARPAIVAGVTLALMETLADFGTVQYFGVSTFTTGIYRSFYGLGDLNAASQLSATLLMFVLCLIVLEKLSRQRAQYFNQSKPSHAVKLKSFKAMVAVAICLLPLSLGFLIPAWQLIVWAITESEWGDEFVQLAFNSFYLALIAAVAAVSLALLMAYAKRAKKSALTLWATSFASMGYALPGTIIAIGVIVPLAWLDQQLIVWAYDQWQWDLGLIFSGSLFALVFAYCVRFLAVSLGAIDSGLVKIKPSLDQAARLAGCSNSQVLRRVHIPLMKTSIFTALLITFVDVLKELPATLILRPFDFNTLAVRAYELASDERLIDAAPASLCIVLVGLLPVILLSRTVHANHSVNH